MVIDRLSDILPKGDTPDPRRSDREMGSKIIFGRSSGWDRCWQPDRVTRQWSGFWLAVRYGSVPDPAKNPTGIVLAGLLPGQ